jgi:hypothetical protein
MWSFDPTGTREQRGDMWSACATYSINWLLFIIEMKCLQRGTDWVFNTVWNVKLLNVKLSVYHVTNRLFNYLVALLTCSILFNNSSTRMHFSQFVKMVPKHLAVVLSFSDRRHLLFCASLPTFRCSVLRIITFRPRLSSISVIYVVFTASSLSRAIYRVNSTYAKQDVLFGTLLAIPKAACLPEGRCMP